MLLRKGYLNKDDIRHGLLAFTLSVRECQTEFLPLDYPRVVKALRILNKTISEVVLAKWYEHC